MNVKPLADRVLVKAVEAKEITEGGIIIPDTASKEKPQEGEIIEVGPGRFEDGKVVPMEVAKGNRVLYGKYSGTEVSVDSEPYMIMRESDILAILS